MKLCLCILLTFLIIETLCTSEDCKEAINCNVSSYESYVNCIRKRLKRSANCDNTCADGDCDNNNCDQCDCNYCGSHYCSDMCNSCCDNSALQCQTNVCCYKTCHAQCSSSSCRRSCKRSCVDRVVTSEKEQIKINGESSSQLHNITTIINLHNQINNTNIIDMPVNINNTNINNITVETSSAFEGKEGGSGSIYVDRTEKSDSRCCNLVSPRQCVPNNAYPYVKCFHYRKHTCGNICQSNIMYAQPHQVCDERPSGPPDCHQQVIYVPRPQPKCAYQPTWPYLSCDSHQPNCNGCYSPEKNLPSHCTSSCYDSGYNFRQGPIYGQPIYGQPPMFGSPLFYGQPAFGGMNFPGLEAMPNFPENVSSNLLLGQSGAIETDDTNTGFLPGSGFVGYAGDNIDGQYTLDFNKQSKPNINENKSTDIMTVIHTPDIPHTTIDHTPSFVKIKTIKHQEGPRDITLTIKQTARKRMASDQDIVTEIKRP